jgi:hypothetical protein
MVITLTSEFECGNGKKIEPLGADRFRLEVDGDKQGGYCVYFCFAVANAGPGRRVTVELWEDSQFGGPTAFPVFFPTTVWLRPGTGERFRPLHESVPELLGDHVVFSVPVAADSQVTVAMTYVAAYSQIARQLRNLAEERPDRCDVFVLGRSAQGREIAGLRAGTPGRPRVYCVAGQHPHEHPGVWAAAGIADFISSRLPEAEGLRQELEVWIVPMVNPDGNVAGRNAFNAEGLDLYTAFGQNPDALEPEAHENRLLWRWATGAKPDLWMNFHAYTGWRENSEFPFEGWYEVTDRSVFREPGQRRLYEALCDSMRLETDAPSTHQTASRHPENTLCHQLAKRHGIPHVFYELNCATSGKHRAARVGTHVFRQAVRTLLHYR